MRRRIAVPLIAAAAALPWFWFHPEAPPDTQPARLLAVIDVPRDADWVGGLSGIDIAEDGSTFVTVTDRGHVARGTLARKDGLPASVEFTEARELTDRFGRVRDFPHTDAEGIALDGAGRVFVSFEHFHRVLFYDDLGGPAQWPSYTRSWRALERNKGLEALAISADGTLFTIPEGIASGAIEALVYRKPPIGRWVQAFTLPVDAEFLPVGADFGPDGRFYLLERGLYPFGFFSRVRRMTVLEDGFSDIETVLHTRLGTHGNLEGLAVWRDPEGAIRLTMVSDDNFRFFLRGQIVEYILDGGLANTEN